MPNRAERRAAHNAAVHTPERTSAGPPCACSKCCRKIRKRNADYTRWNRTHRRIRSQRDSTREEGGARHRRRGQERTGPLIVAQEVSSATPPFRYLNVRHFLATFGGFCPTFLPTFWPFGPQICPKSAIDLQKLDFRPHFFVIFASGSVYGLEIAVLRRGLELAVTFNFVDA